MAVATDERAPAAIAPIAVGFALAIGVFIAGPVTGERSTPHELWVRCSWRETSRARGSTSWGRSSGGYWPRSSTTALWPRPRPPDKGAAVADHTQPEGVGR